MRPFRILPDPSDRARSFFMQQCLYFLPESHGHGELRPVTSGTLMGSGANGWRFIEARPEPVPTSLTSLFSSLPMAHRFQCTIRMIRHR